MLNTFDIFDKPPVDISIDHEEYTHVLPLSGAVNENTIDFYVPPQSEQYTDLSSCYLHLNVKLTAVDQADIEAAKISLISLWPQTLWKQVDLYLGQKLVSTSTNHASFRSWIETVLSFPSEVQKHQLSVLEHLNGYDFTGGAGVKSESVEGFTRLNLDMMQQNRYLINEVPLSIRLYRNSDKFVLKSSSEKAYSLSIEDISLYVKHVTPSSALLLEHAKLLSKKTAVYSIDRSLMKTQNLTKGSQEETIPNLFMGQLPVRIVLGMVKSSDYIGDIKTDPFNFQHFNVSHVSLSVNGRQIPERAFEPNFSTSKCRREYFHLMETVLGNCMDERSIGITLDDYINKGKTLFGFNLVPEGGGNSSVFPRRQGNINLRLRFKEALPHNVTILVFSEYQNVIEIDAARQIYTDFG